MNSFSLRLETKKSILKKKHKNATWPFFWPTLLSGMFIWWHFVDHRHPLSVSLLIERHLTLKKNYFLTSEEEVGPGDEGSGVNKGVLLIFTALQLQQMEKGHCESQTSWSSTRRCKVVLCSVIRETICSSWNVWIILLHKHYFRYSNVTVFLS